MMINESESYVLYFDAFSHFCYNYTNKECIITRSQGDVFNRTSNHLAGSIDGS